MHRVATPLVLAKYDIAQSYEWNYDNVPEPVQVEVPDISGPWTFCGKPIASPLGIPAGPLLNGRWAVYYANLGFDVLTYKTVRSRARECYALPNLQPVATDQLRGTEKDLSTIDEMTGSWAVSFGMPSKLPADWRADVEWTRNNLPAEKLLSVSVVGSIQPDWSLDDLADDYASCAKWAVDSGADCIETNFSCPNVSTCDGQLYQEPQSAALVVSRVRESIGNTPYIIKVGHVSQRDSAELLLESVAPYVNAIAATNSVAATVRGKDGRPLFEGERRGICGDATRTASTEQIRLFAEIRQQRGWNFSLVGVGGASTAQHVHEYLAAGAEAVHIATAAMIDPAVGLKIRHDW